MQVVKGNAVNLDVKARAFTKKSMNEDYNFLKAQNMIELLVEEGLLSKEEGNLLARKNIDSFNPFYKELL